jgi:hypothetical protein
MSQSGLQEVKRTSYLLLCFIQNRDFKIAGPLMAVVSGMTVSQTEQQAAHVAITMYSANGAQVVANLSSYASTDDAIMGLMNIGNYHVSADNPNMLRFVKKTYLVHLLYQIIVKSNVLAAKNWINVPVKIANQLRSYNINHKNV